MKQNDFKMFEQNATSDEKKRESERKNLSKYLPYSWETKKKKTSPSTIHSFVTVTLMVRSLCSEWMSGFFFSLRSSHPFSQRRTKNSNDDLKFLSRDMLQHGKWNGREKEREKKKKFGFPFYNKCAQLQLNWKFNMYLITTVT